VPDITLPIDKVEPHGILLTLRDGTKATVLKIGYSATRWNFVCKLAGERQPRVTSHYVGPWTNRCLFMALCAGPHELAQFPAAGEGAPERVQFALIGSLAWRFRSKSLQVPCKANMVWRRSNPSSPPRLSHLFQN